MRHEPLRTRAVEAQVDQALTAAAHAAGIAATVVEHRATPWASATFAGMQHRLVIAAPGAPALGGWIAALPDAEFALRGHLVASLAVDRLDDDGTTARVTLVVLTIEG